MPRGRRSQTTPRPSTTTTTTAHSDSVSSTKAAPVLNSESANATAEANPIIALSQSGEIVEINAQIVEEDSKPAVVQEPTTDSKEDTVPQQLLNCHSQNGGSASPTKIDSIETMADADHINANGSKIDTTLSSCDKDYNEEKEFQRASKVFFWKFQTCTKTLDEFPWF